jgi:hypothetical protein
VAILSLHSHADRSFLDDQLLALVSGDIKELGIENDIVLAILNPAGGDGPAGSAAEQRLIETLRNYDVIVFERVWSRDLIARIREALSEKVWVWCQGEHALLAPPADWAVEGIRGVVPDFLQYVCGLSEVIPSGVFVVEQGRLRGVGSPDQTPKTRTKWHPNLRPVIINPEALPAFQTFSITGNEGCPYQADARENPVYVGTKIPTNFGRGCAFCTTGNTYDGKPSTETAATVLEHLRYVRHHAPELQHIRLKDQNPFAYLTEVIATAAAEKLGPFTMMLETRADWMLRSARRIEQALTHAQSAGIRLAPFLVGIENFSQPELDRFNKGISGEANIQFLETLWAWKERFGDALDLSHASFGFILFTPWTTLDDVAANHAAIVRTRLDRFRGSLLLARARLYPDTALYYLAQRDGLLAEEFRSEEENSSRRYGYYPSHPWKFLHPETEHFSAVAIEAVNATGGRDQVALMGALLEAFKSASDYRTVTAADALARIKREVRASNVSLQPASTELRTRFAKLLAPVPLDGTFADGWRIENLSTGPGIVRVKVARGPAEPAITLELAPRKANLPALARSRHYDIRSVSGEISESQRVAVRTVCDAIVQNDR